jgi:hypothetical protein
MREGFRTSPGSRIHSRPQSQHARYSLESTLQGEDLVRVVGHQQWRQRRCLRRAHPQRRHCVGQVLARCPSSGVGLWASSPCRACPGTSGLRRRSSAGDWSAMRANRRIFRKPAQQGLTTHRENGSGVEREQRLQDQICEQWGGWGTYCVGFVAGALEMDHAVQAGI